MKKRVQQDKKNRIVPIIICLLILSIYFLSTGYSAFSATGKIEGIMASVEPRTSVRITNITLNGVTNGGVSTSESYNVANIFGYIELPNADSTVTYKVDVTTFNAAVMKLVDITGLDNNLEYSISGYTMGEPLCDSHGECNLGSTDDMYITIGYKSGSYNSSNTTFPFNLEFEFEQVIYTAKIGSAFYQTVQDAVDAVPTNDTKTTIQILKNCSERVEISSGQNVEFNFNGHTLSDYNSSNVIVNSGTLHFTNGTIISAANQGAIHNYGTLYMSGGTISVTSTAKQTIYNDGGTVEISGGTMTSASTQKRPSVHNLSNGTMLITGGTITSDSFYGVQNDSGTLTIGTKDGNPEDVPVIRGKTYGVYTVPSINYYDGIIKGATAAFNDETLIGDTDPALTMMRNVERISGTNFQTVQLGIPITITFNANGGTVSPSSKTINNGSAIGILPTPTRQYYTFMGWFDDPDNGNEITENTTFSANDTIYAHWAMIVYAMIGNTEYTSVQDAVNAAPNNTQTTVVLVKDARLGQVLKINSNKNIILDFNNHTLSNGANSMPIIENEGTLTIKDGTITSNSDQGAVNNRVNGATLTIDNMTITATGTRQALYNEKGNATITGNSQLSNTSTERPAVHNKTSGSVTILSATIVSSNYSGVGVDGGTITIGTKDGNISTTSPSIRGATYGAQKTSGTLNYYDGVLKGVTNAIGGTVSDTNGTIVLGSESISGDTYETAHLE